MDDVEPYQAGAGAGYNGDPLDPDLIADPAYQTGASEGRTARVDEQLLAWDRAGRPGRPDPDALLGESDRLFTEHHALARENQRRAGERERTMEAARARQTAAHAAHTRAADAWEAAIEARRGDPGNLALVGKLDQAEAAYQAACAEAERVNREVQTVLAQVFDESQADTEALLALGPRARAAQDAWFLATMHAPEEG